MRVLVIAVGRAGRDSMADVVDEYAKRSRPYLPIETAFVRDKAAAWARLKDQGAAVLLDERGEAPSTLGLRDWISRWRDDGLKQAAFAIGDADGWDDQDRARADRILSLSPMTLPHRLARVVLVEQLYRVGTLLAGHPYHHGG